MNRRQYVASLAFLAAGCLRVQSDGGTDGPENTAETESGETASSGATTTQTTVENTPTADGDSETESPAGTLDAGGSSTVYDVMDKAASYWNSNPPPSDAEYWPHGEYGIATDMNLADYWASRYGFEQTNEDSSPPFQITVGVSDSGQGLTELSEGQLDIGNSATAVENALPARDSYDQFTDHVIAADGYLIVVSREIIDAGVGGLTGQELRDIYRGRVTNWQQVGGPDVEIQAFSRVEGSGVRTAFVVSLYGDPQAETSVANRFGQEERLAKAIAQKNNAIGYVSPTVLDTYGVGSVALTWEGTTYEYGADRHGLAASGYPFSRDLHAYTWNGTDRRESALLNMLLSDFGQDVFVAPNDYFTLGRRRRNEQRDRLAPQRA